MGKLGISHQYDLERDPFSVLVERVGTGVGFLLSRLRALLIVEDGKLGHSGDQGLLHQYLDPLLEKNRYSGPGMHSLSFFDSDDQKIVCIKVTVLDTGLAGSPNKPSGYWSKIGS